MSTIKQIPNLNILKLKTGLKNMFVMTLLLQSVFYTTQAIAETLTHKNNQSRSTASFSNKPTIQCSDEELQNAFTAEEVTKYFSLKVILAELNKSSDLSSIKTTIASYDKKIQCYRLGYMQQAAKNLADLQNANVVTDTPYEDNESFMFEYLLSRAEAYLQVYTFLNEGHEKSKVCTRIENSLKNYIRSFSTDKATDISTANKNTTVNGSNLGDEIGEDDIMVGSHLKYRRSKFIEINKPLLKNICPDLDLEKATGNSRKK